MRTKDITYVTIASRTYPVCRTNFQIHPAEPGETELVLVVDSGCARLQTYATRDELRELAEALLAVASEAEVLEVAA